jgi:nucleoside-diphosphate-sugar epimerase
MHVVITGGHGFLGARLAGALLARGTIAGGDGTQQPISRLVLTDIAASPSQLHDPRLETIAGDLADPACIEAIGLDRADSVFHLAALVSGGAEADFTAGYRSNLFGTWNVLEALRRGGRRPRVVFASSVAAYGGDLPAIVPDTHHLVPESSYGVQKVIGEQLINDLSRRGAIDGRSIRLPIIAIRPGKANTALSSWASALVREPLNGDTYACPVEPTDRGFVLSPKQAIAGMIVAHDSDAAVWGRDRSVMMAGLTCTAGSIVDALRRIAGDEVAARISWAPHAPTRRVINSWPTAFANNKARRIGLEPDASVDEIIQNYIEELGQASATTSRQA